ncbi:MAG TPA: glycosyltransferase [Candidatus Cloacimonadota bacterium]|nr:glycosyltransferase [Candidatus Cloacimonadota bacterium]HPT70778.1 glycosyltransferase [Candidatus Cloacimonadota bacterium]
MDVILLIYVIILLNMSFAMFRKWKTNTPLQHTYSIIAVGRNESERLPGFLASLKALDYPTELYEIILVDDASSDDTFNQMNEFANEKNNIQVFQVKESEKIGKGKRQALTLAAKHATKDILLFTDTDTEVPVHWISSYNSYFYTIIGMVIGYVRMKHLSLIYRVKRIFSSGLFCSTVGMGIPFSCSGANIAIRRFVYEDIGGHEGLGDFHAGDDKLLLKKMHQLDYKIGYNSDETMIEQNQKYTFKQLLDREIRQYGKIKLSSTYYILFTALVFAFFIFLPFLLVHHMNWVYLAGIILPIYLFYSCSLIIHHERFHPLDYIFLLVYPYYAIFFSIISLFVKAKWKA